MEKEAKLWIISILAAIGAVIIFTAIVHYSFRAIRYLAFLVCDTIGRGIKNLITAYKWSRMPIQELNAMWEEHSRYGYRRIRKGNCFLAARYILTTRVRKYRKSLNYDEMKNIKSIRFDDRTWMLLTELSQKTGKSVSVIIRSIVMKNIDEWLDATGNWVDGEKKEL